MPINAPIIETIRKGLIGALTDFVNESGFIAQINLIVELVYELAEYREEDIRFFQASILLSVTMILIRSRSSLQAQTELA